MNDSIRVAKCRNDFALRSYTSWFVTICTLSSPPETFSAINHTQAPFHHVEQSSRHWNCNIRHIKLGILQGSFHYLCHQNHKWGLSLTHHTSKFLHSHRPKESQGVFELDIGHTQAALPTPGAFRIIRDVYSRHRTHPYIYTTTLRNTSPIQNRKVFIRPWYWSLSVSIPTHQRLRILRDV